MDENKTPKNAEQLHCSFCDFKCSKKSDWERHIMRPKHQNNAKRYENDDKKTPKNASNTCNCGKIYKHYSGLWRHQQNCIIEKPKENQDLLAYLMKQNQDLQQQICIIEKPKEKPDLVTYLMAENKDFKDLLIEQNKTIIEAMKHHSISNVNSIVNSNNKTFNLQVFLNEDCKDAMNISDFMSSIQLQLEELVSVGKLGFVEGISNIIIKNLKALDIRKRPLHCTDLKRETVYIKDNGVWVKDDEDNTKLRKVIKNVAFRNSKNTRLFKDKYPDCVRSESRLSDTYSIIIIEAMGGGSKTDPKESEDKILRRILKELTIDKSKYLS